MSSETDEKNIASFKNHVSLSLTTFALFTLIFVMFKCFVLYKYAPSSGNISNIKLMFSLIYNIFFFFILFFNNLSVTENDLICGDRNYKAAVYSTIIPFIFIYGIGVLFITIFPGWVRCFSNTFGSSILNIIGLEDEVKSQLTTSNTDGTSGNTNSREEPQLLGLFENNPKIILNELEIRKNKVDTESLNHILNVEYLGGNIENLLKQYIITKESIGEGIWDLLLGIITIMMSYNTILSEKCNAFENDNDKFKKYITDKYYR